MITHEIMEGISGLKCLESGKQWYLMYKPNCRQWQKMDLDEQDFGQNSGEGALQLGLVMSGAYKCSPLIAPVFSAKQETIMCENKLR